MSNSRQLQIRYINANGDLSTPVKYPVGCVHRFVNKGLTARVYHPDDKNPAWHPECADDDTPEYLTCYAQQSCSHGLHVEYVPIEVPLPQNDSHQLRPAA